MMWKSTRKKNSQGSLFDYDRLYEYPIPKELRQALNFKKPSNLSRLSKMYSKVLESIRKVRHVDLSENHYLQLLKLALYLEDYQCNLEMHKRKLFNQTIWINHKIMFNRTIPLNSFNIYVGDLDEERPWIRENDFVEVTDTRTRQSFILKVTNVMKTHIVAIDESARLQNIFKPSNRYDIDFKFQNYPLRCAHYALWICYKENIVTYLFPTKLKSFIDMNDKIYASLTMINRNIERNPEQKQAVIHIVNKSSFPAPYILYGPPGTGKTATLVEAICQIRRVNICKRILVCTPSNTAADEIAVRLLKYVKSTCLYRLYSQSKNRFTIDKELKECSYYGKIDRSDLESKKIDGKQILITTLCTATRFLLMNLEYDYFSHIIIDEAGQGIEADILIPISIASKHNKLHSQIVLAGDPKQLGPTVISKVADIILGRSILERLMSYDIYQKDSNNKYNPKYIVKLLRNYRSHPNIIHISNKLFYDNELIAKGLADNEVKTFPVIFHGVKGIEEKTSHSTSTFNIREIGMVLKYVDDLLGNRTEFGNVSTKDIGIVTPFTLQSKNIKKILKQRDETERKIADEKLKKIKILKKAMADKANSESVNEKSKNNEVESETNVKNASDNEEQVDVNSEKNLVESENQSDVKPQKNDEKSESDKKEKINANSDKNVTESENQTDVKTKKNDEENQMELTNFGHINVGTVELFQGQERKIMIMTAVRSKMLFHNGNEHIGFLSNPKRFNVAISRAKNVLIVIGNPDILQNDHMWYYLLKYCLDNGSYRGSKFALRDLQNDHLQISESQSIATSASLFKGNSFKLFRMDCSDLSDGVAETVDVFVEPDKEKSEDTALTQRIQNMSLEY